MELPPPLAPWRSGLGWFEQDIVTLLDELARRLHPLLGPVAATRVHGRSEHDGLDGLQRNGSYERLLPSEWALAELEPDEFLRRAASGEQLFLAPRRTLPRAQGLIVALFDSGPDQLGAPRLVHIALALLLAQRAAARGTRFAWGCLQEQGALAELTQPVHLQRLLLSRSLRAADANDRAHWKACLAAGETAECWLVGTADAGELTPSHRVSVQGRLDDQLHVRVSSTRQPRELLLQPPHSAAAARLLRGEFAGVAAPVRSSATQLKRSLSLTQAPLLDWRGQRVAVPLLESNTLLFLRLKSNGQLLHSPLRWRRGASLLAAVFSGGNLGGVMAAGEHLRGWNLRHFERWPRPAAQDLACIPGLAHWLRGVFLDGASGPPALLLLDRNGNLAQWRYHGERRFARQESEGAVGLQSLSRQVLHLHQAGPQEAVIAQLRDGRLELTRIQQDLQQRSGIFSHNPAQLPDTVFLAGGIDGKDWLGCCAHAVARGGNRSTQWTLVHMENDGKSSIGSVSLPPDCSGLGLARAPDTPQQYGLLVLDQARLRLRVFATAPQDLYLADAPIRQVSVSDDGERIALVTERRELLLIEAATRRVLMHLGGKA